jgi:hypothetical protein
MSMAGDRTSDTARLIGALALPVMYWMHGAWERRRTQRGDNVRWFRSRAVARCDRRGVNDRLGALGWCLRPAFVDIGDTPRPNRASGARSIDIIRDEFGLATHS